MSTLSDILTQFPSARVTITLSNRRSKPRVKPREYDEKTTKSRGVLVRLQRKAYHGRHFIGYLVKNGRPCYHWVRESNLDERERQQLAYARAQRARNQSQ